MVLNGVGHDAPDAEVVVFRHFDGFEGGVGGNQVDGILLNSYELQSEFTVDVANGCVAVLRIQRLVNDQDISVQNTGILHRLALDAAEKRGGRVRNKLLVQVQP